MLDNYIQQLNKIAKLLIRMATEMTVELEVKEQEHKALKEKFKIINFPMIFTRKKEERQKVSTPY